MGAPARVGSVRQHAPYPSLPAREASHPGQRLLLLRAQVPDSAAHGARSCRGSRGVGVPGVLARRQASPPPGFAPRIRYPFNPEDQGPALPRPAQFSPPLGLFFGGGQDSPNPGLGGDALQRGPGARTPGEGNRCHHLQAPSSLGLLPVPAWQGKGRRWQA